ncbi:hypothetical protein V6Z11_A05G436200 [Gossypium hirsutum]
MQWRPTFGVRQDFKLCIKSKALVDSNAQRLRGAWSRRELLSSNSNLSSITLYI